MFYNLGPRNGRSGDVKGRRRGRQREEGHDRGRAVSAVNKRSSLPKDITSNDFAYHEFTYNGYT
jgi:hypothetical protein